MQRVDVDDVDGFDSDNNSKALTNPFSLRYLQISTGPVGGDEIDGGKEGLDVGLSEGETVGAAVGDSDGLPLGELDGDLVGSDVGCVDGEVVG